MQSETKPDCKGKHKTVLIKDGVAKCKDCGEVLKTWAECTHKRCRPIPDRYLYAVCEDCGKTVTVGLVKR